MDARIKRLAGDVESLKKHGLKSVLQEVSQRDHLAEVAAYGVQKLGIKVTAGQESAALEGYLAGRVAPSASVAMDSAPTPDVFKAYGVRQAARPVIQQTTTIKPRQYWRGFSFWPCSCVAPFGIIGLRS